MTQLTVYPDTNPAETLIDTRDADEIARTLANIGVRFERWNASIELAEDAGQEAVLAAYAHEVERLMREGGYRTVDVVRVKPDHPDRVAMRQKFFAEHTHAEDEVRFFVEGAGVFYLRIDGRVYVILCERDDLLGVPAGTRHWFDMGPEPHFTAIRLFTTPAGWVAKFTGDPIAQRFPSFEKVAA
jgi:1,2-dihydroxy-3-keto-5-methylthiopentene dioxygenase